MDLGVAIVGNIYFRSHNGKTFGLDSLGKMPQFLAREQKFAVSERFVAAPGRSPEVCRNIHPAQIQLTSREIAIGLLQRRFTGTDGLYLCPDQNYTGIVLLKKLIFK